MNMSILNLNEFSETSQSERWTIVETLLSNDERHGTAKAIDGPPGNVVTIGDLRQSLSTGTLFSATVSKSISAFFVRYRRDPWKIAAINLNSQKKAHRWCLED